jgi:hypothetical protein
MNHASSAGATAFFNSLLMAAVRYARDVGVKNIETRVGHLAQCLRGALMDIDGVEVHDLGEKKCGIVTLTKAGTDPSRLADGLLRAGINVSVSAMAYARLDLEPRKSVGVASGVRTLFQHAGRDRPVRRSNRRGMSILNFLVGMNSMSGLRFRMTLHLPSGFGTTKILDQNPDEG